MLRLFTFGGLRLEHDGQLLQLPAQKARELLAYLVTFRRRHLRPVLAGLLWPDLPEGQARRRLSDALWRVHHLLGDYVQSDEHEIWFNTALPYWLDAEEFEGAAATLEARPVSFAAALPARPPDPDRLAGALALYQGDFLAGLYADWVILVQERLRLCYLGMLNDLLQRCKQAGDYAAALGYAQRLIGADPLQETAHREVMRLYHLLGRDAEAIAQYHRCRQILQDELDVAPAPETEALYQVLGRQVARPSDVPDVHLPAPARFHLLDLAEPPLVGREVERAALLGHLETAAAGRGGMVLLEGEAGIGKSRLARELRAGAHWRGFCVTAAAAGQTEVPASYALLLAVLVPLLAPLRLRQLSRLVEPAYLQATASILPALAESLPGLPPLAEMPPAQARQRLLQALCAVIVGLARISPHLWILEDLQWADPETLSLLPGLLPHLRENRALFVLTGRGGALRANPAAWNALRAVDRAGPFPRYTLPRLDAPAVDDMVQALLGRQNAALAEHLARESEGVPLYAVEMLKDWRDEGYLQPTERGVWRWTGQDLAGLPAYPGWAVIPQRLSHLSPAAGQILDVIAAAGTEVEYDLLAEAGAPPGVSPDSTAANLALLTATDELLRLGLLVETDTGYRFSHEQVRQAVYGRLPPPRRQRLHRRVARALEEFFPQRFEELAHHFAAAGETPRAVYYLGQAAKLARDRYAHATALSCYGRLLELSSPAADRAARYDVLRDRAEVLGWIGDREAQGRDLEEMLRLAAALSDEARLAGALHQRSEWHRLQGHYLPAEEDALAALELYLRLGHSATQADLLVQLGWNLVYTADAPRAEPYFQQALAIYREIADLEGQINCLSGLVALAELDGDYFQALAHMGENLALAQATANPLRVGRALHNMGVLYYDLGDLDTADGYLQQALQVKATIGDRRSQALTQFYLGLVATDRGSLSAAQDQLEAARGILAKVQDKSWEGDALAALGRLALAQEDPRLAQRHLQAAYQRRCQLGQFNYAVIDLSYLALAELGLGEHTVAWRRSLEAIGRVEGGLEGVEQPQQVYYNHFLVAHATRHWASARAALERAAEIVAERAGRIGDSILCDTYCTRHPLNRAIASVLALQPPPGRLRVHLARADVPAQRRPGPTEGIAVVWTVDAGPADAALGRRESKVSLRRKRILRLLAEAEAAGARAAIPDLAGALDVSARTIRADLAALRKEGHAIRTRGG